MKHCHLFSKAYYCKALNGESRYNICVNSDMTVSCNCWDYDGSGHIGDLKKQTLKQIFDGDTAQAFRRKLARGRIPILACARCSELQQVKKPDAIRCLTDYTVPKRGIMVENTALCNLNCAVCPRDRIMKTRKKMRMSLEDMRKVAETISDYQIKSVAFHNLGEPFLSKNVFDEINILRKYNPQVWIYSSTNGLLLNSTEKKEAALLMDHIYFSIDGSSQDFVAAYQVGGNFERSYTNMKELVDFRNSRNQVLPVIEWKYVVFSWNDGENAIERAVELAKEAHVDIISFWPGFGSYAAVSQRFLRDPYFQRLGEKSWKGREIDFREYSYSGSMKSAEEFGEKGKSADALYKSGLMFEKQAKHKEAIDMYMKSLRAFRDLKDNQNVAALHGQIGINCEYEGRYKDAMRNYVSAVELFKLLKSPCRDLAIKDLLRVRDKLEEETFNVYLAELFEDRKANG